MADPRCTLLAKNLVEASVDIMGALLVSYEMVGKELKSFSHDTPMGNLDEKLSNMRASTEMAVRKVKRIMEKLETSTLSTDASVVGNLTVGRIGNILKTMHYREDTYCAAERGGSSTGEVCHCKDCNERPDALNLCNCPECRSGRQPKPKVAGVKRKHTQAWGWQEDDTWAGN